MTFLTLTPWLHRNVYDEDGRVWYEECISARFIRPIEEAVRGALKNADWDPLPPQAGKGKKASAVLSRPTPGRKRGREAANAEVAVTEDTPAERVAAEAEASERPTKRALPLLLEGEDEEEVPSVIVSEAPPVIAPTTSAEVVVMGAPVAEATTAEASGTEVIVTEVPDAGMAVIEAPADEAVTPESPAGEATEAEATAGGDGCAPPRPLSPSSPALIIPSSQVVPAVMSMPLAPTSQESTVATELAMVEATATGAPSPPPVSSTVLTELAVAEVLAAPSVAEEPASSDDLAELYTSLHEEGSSSASAPLDEDSRATVERL
ncbi:predicted GPI-anchored protein 58 [Prunus avium]|uniref:Predicted GPI-anchored protein 58 n=1 Tax=Prunus avium TaxID=42229 RepID=A0A6P5S922_PRUAV|nr:predicted GPI-anchored protein 58 [Prunus avium]